MSSTAPETITLDLTPEQVSHATTALQTIVSKQEADGDGDHPANVQARVILGKLPSEGGQVVLNLDEAYRLEKGVGIHDADYNPFALLLGSFERSDTLTSVTQQIDAAIEGVDPASIDAVLDRQQTAAGFVSDDEQALLEQPVEAGV